MSKTASILRAYDIRGIVGETLTAKDAYYVGRGFAAKIKGMGKRTVCVGRDGRLSSPEMMHQLVKGLAEGGLQVTMLGLGPTPMVYFAMHHYDCDAAVMVTGSHNSADYNGFKMCLRTGPMFDQDIQALGQTVAVGKFSLGVGLVNDQDPKADYLAHILKDFRTYYADGKPLKVAWDAGNGSAGELLEQLVSELPGEHILLNTTIDGTFPAHHPDPVVPENLVQLQDAVKTNKCDLGIAFDGDGDRIGVIDARGHIIWGDLLVTLFAQEVLKTHAGAPIIADIKASQVFFDEVKRLGGQPIMCRTGHSMIKAKMKEIDCPLAGEMSGHMFFADRYFGFDDALYAALRLIGIVSTQEKTLSQWLGSLPKRFTTPEMVIKCADDVKFQVVADVTQRLQTQNAKVNTTDGVRVSTSDGWWLLRASNTQAALVARAEAETSEGVDQLVQELGEQLRASGLELKAVAPLEFAA